MLTPYSEGLSGVKTIDGNDISLDVIIAYRIDPQKAPYILQYVAPTLVLLEAVLLFNEHLAPATLIAFCFIWAGLVVYSIDAWMTVRKN